MITTMLISLAEVSNVFSVFLVFLVFCAMVVFILRLHSEDFRMTSVTFVNNQPVTQTPMMRVMNPFVFSLKRSQDCQQSINDVVCSVSSKVPWMLQAMWGVSISDFHPLLLQPWITIKEAISDGVFLTDGCLQLGNLQHYSECSDMEIRINTSSSICKEDLGTSPRTKYPLVVILIRQGDCLSDKRDVGALVNIIHFQDDLCPLPTGILAQYVKMTDGQLSTLKQLYVVGEDEQTVDEDGKESLISQEKNSVESESEERLKEVICVVCQIAPVTRALLPCRHVCSCKMCFSRLDKCPLCRSQIDSYFCTAEEHTTTEPETEMNEPRPLNWKQRLDHWNEWLNQLLGLT